MRAFEIHTYLDGKWRIDSVFDDRELVLFEARRVEVGGRYSRVRVVEEIHDESTGQTTTRTIFRGGTIDRQKKARKAVRAVKARIAPGRGAGSRETAKNSGNWKNRKNTTVLIPVFILTGLVIAGLAALFGLQEWTKFR